MALSCLTCNLFQQQFNNNKNSSLLSLVIVVIFACLTVQSEAGSAPPPPPKVCFGEPFGPRSHAVGETNHDGKCICRHGGDWSLTQAGFDDNCDCAWNGMITCFPGFRKPQCKRFDGATSLTSTTSMTYYSAGDKAFDDKDCLCVKVDAVWGEWQCTTETAHKKELAMNTQASACDTTAVCSGTETEYCFWVNVGQANPVQYQMSQCQLNRDVMCPNPSYSLVGLFSGSCSSASSSSQGTFTNMAYEKQQHSSSKKLLPQESSACKTNVDCDGTETEYCFWVDIGEAQPVQYQMSQCQLNRDVMCLNPNYSLVGFPSNTPCSSSSQGLFVAMAYDKPQHSSSKKLLPQASCPAGKVYSECASCVQTCDDLVNGIICPAVCTAGCSCPSGYKDFNGACVLESRCAHLVQPLTTKHSNTVTTHKSVEMNQQSLQTNVGYGNQSQGGEKVASEFFLQIALVVSGGVCCALAAVVVLLVAKNNKQDLLLTSNNQVLATGAMNV